MSKVTNIAEVTKFSWRTAGGVVVGLALFGTLIWGVRSLPNNAITAPIKTAAAVATNTAPATGGE